MLMPCLRSPWKHTMNNVIRLLLGFLVGGVCVAATTIIAERHGSRLGGFIGGLPSTLAIALLFVALTGGKDLAIQAAGISPLAFGISGLFVLMFVALSRYGFFWSMGLSLTAWVAAQSAIVVHGAPTLGFSIVAWGVCFCICWLGFKFGVKVKAQSSSGTSSNFGDFLIRALASGVLVTVAAAASLWGGPVISGVLASLPVVLICSIFITYHRVGLSFARAIARSLVFSAIINCSIFALFFRATLFHFDILPAFVVAYLATLVVALPLYRLNLG